MSARAPRVLCTRPYHRVSLSGGVSSRAYMGELRVQGRARGMPVRPVRHARGNGILRYIERYTLSGVRVRVYVTYTRV